jgi:hypothetical protein
MLCGVGYDQSNKLYYYDTAVASRTKTNKTLQSIIYLELL